MLRGIQINYMPEKSHVVILISVSHSLTLVVGWPHRSYKIKNIQIWWFSLTCPSASFALQYGDFVPRDCPAAKGPLVQTSVSRSNSVQSSPSRKPRTSPSTESGGIRSQLHEPILSAHITCSTGHHRNGNECWSQEWHTARQLTGKCYSHDNSIWSTFIQLSFKK